MAELFGVTLRPLFPGVTTRVGRFGVAFFTLAGDLAALCGVDLLDLSTDVLGLGVLLVLAGVFFDEFCGVLLRDGRGDGVASTGDALEPALWGVFCLEALLLEAGVFWLELALLLAGVFSLEAFLLLAGVLLLELALFAGVLCFDAPRLGAGLPLLGDDLLDVRVSFSS